MGTRSITRVKDELGQSVAAIYRQYDGYLSGHGADLREGFGLFKIINGLGKDTTNVANGMGCLAAQIVAKLKTKAGGVYLVPTDADDEEFVYEIYPSKTCGRVMVKMSGHGFTYDGPLADLPKDD